jgi:hypothetical protein
MARIHAQDSEAQRHAQDSEALVGQCKQHRPEDLLPASITISAPLPLMLHPRVVRFYENAPQDLTKPKPRGRTFPSRYSTSLPKILEQE